MVIFRINIFNRDFLTCRLNPDQKFEDTYSLDRKERDNFSSNVRRMQA